MEDNQVQDEIQRERDERTIERFASLAGCAVAAYYHVLIQAGVPVDIAGQLAARFNEIYVSHYINPK